MSLSPDAGGTPAADPTGDSATGGETTAAPVGDKPGEPATDVDVDRLCSLLEPAEIEAELGEHGSADAGTLATEMRSCTWMIGQALLQLRVPQQQRRTPLDRLTSERESQEQDENYESETVDVDGVGDYAYALLWEGTTQLVVLTGDTVFFLYMYIPATDELAVLARHVVERI